MATRIEIAEGQTKTDLTRTQKQTGDYEKGRVNLRGLAIAIENPKGSVRTGVDTFGNQWRSVSNFTYGYIENTVGNDSDEVDIFLGPLSNSRQVFDVYVVNQVDPLTRAFDEHKVMFGFSSVEEAKEAYLSCYQQGWTGLKSVKTYSMEEFMTWVGTYKKPTAAKYTNKVVAAEETKTLLIKLEGEIIENETLLSLQEQAGDISEFGTLIISIASPGGDVQEGIKIMMWMDYLSSIGIKVVTIVVANAYSIASLIMLAADYTLIGKYADVMVHNPMIPELKLANANELEVHIKQLRELEASMYEIYEVFTDLSVEEIKQLMDNETYLSAEDAVKLGFADELADIPERPKVLAINKNKKLDMKKTLNVLNKVIALVSGSDVVNQLYYDEKGGAVEIYQQDPSTYSVGDRTSVENGQFKLSDGSTVTVENWVITLIDKSTIPAMTEGATAPAAPVAPVTVAEEAPAVPVVPSTEEAPAASFNTGPAPATEEVKPAATEAAPATEEVNPAATETPVTEAAPAAPKTEEVAPAAVLTPEEALVKIEELCGKIEKLEERLSKLEGGQTQMVEKMQESEKFEALASEAIDMLAQNTVSGFKPAAKASATESAGESA